MDEKRNILIIENQFWQFDQIRIVLCGSHNYAPFPNCSSQNEFIKFIDNVRVWVNEQYECAYRDKALANIMQKIDNSKDTVELILMDHILGGASHCLTGIDLAFKINEERKIKNRDILPVLFLSKTSQEDKKREEGFTTGLTHSKGINEYEKEFDKTYDWVHKGYFGDDILKSEYFTQRVIPCIGNVIGKSKEIRFWEIVDDILNQEWETHSNIINTLRRIKVDKDYRRISNRFKIAVNDFYSAQFKKLETLNFDPYEEN